MRLKGKKALVTGGANGIGAAICRHFRQEGADVFVVDWQEAVLDGLEAVPGPGKILSHRCDVGDAASVDAACKAALAAFGRIDILVNNAGGSGTQPAPSIETTTDEIWRTVFDVNVTSILRFSRHLLPAMKEAGWGRIINMSSRSRRGVPVGFPTMKSPLSYVVSKGAVEALTRQFGIELGPTGVTCNAIAPGLVFPDPEARITQIFEGQPEDFKRRHIGAIPVGRAGTGDDIAMMAVYLASQASEFVTGQTIDINGGAR